MRLQKFRWSTVYESPEEELLGLFAVKKLDHERIEHEAFGELATYAYDRDKTIWCAEGSFNLSCNGQKFSMQPGDAIRIPSDLTLDTAPGISGCAFYVTDSASKSSMS